SLRWNFEVNAAGIDDHDVGTQRFQGRSAFHRAGARIEFCTVRRTNDRVAGHVSAFELAACMRANPVAGPDRSVRVTEDDLTALDLHAERSFERDVCESARSDPSHRVRAEALHDVGRCRVDFLAQQAYGRIPVSGSLLRERTV